MKKHELMAMHINEWLLRQYKDNLSKRGSEYDEDDILKVFTEHFKCDPFERARFIDNREIGTIHFVAESIKISYSTCYYIIKLKGIKPVCQKPAMYNIREVQEASWGLKAS